MSMFARDTVITMGDEKGTCIPIGVLAELVTKGGLNFTSQKAPKNVYTQVGAPPGLEINTTGYRTLSGVEQVRYAYFADMKIEVDELTTKEHVLLVRTKLGGHNDDYPLQNAWLKRRKAQIVTPLTVSTGECVEVVISTSVREVNPFSEDWTLTCSPRTKLCLAEGAGYVYAEEVDRDSVIDTYYGSRRIRTTGPANSSMDIRRKTGPLVNIKLWTHHLLLANGIWILTD